MYIYVPEHGSFSIKAFPAVILDYRVEDTGAYREDGEHVIVPGRYERDLVDWACQFAQRDAQFIDCGAHMGSWSIVMARHFREVHAFEPQRLIFQRLCGNVTLNGLTNVFAYNRGLDAVPGQLTLHRSGKDRGSSSTRSDVMEHLFKDSDTPLSPEIIEVTTLDSVAATLNNVRLIKIDVEGLELRVLKGARAILEAHRPKLLIECWSSEWYGEDKNLVLRYLDEIHYRVVPIMGYADMLLAEPR